ncbi:hypothetical protein BS47DRAFT_1323455 [Hydnum rufescens UP504]|uniref:VTT domain-containing protein n=1 Tax=Hydnum rufescens UP504 TaxID=1448309 RepID=A0A9P6E2E6_9AGAM|nr:hypothetical protein BS47DRAFT_1323455 [Hydnum rufescens UP504]
MASTSGGPGNGSSRHYAHTLHNKSSSLTLCTIRPAVDSSSSSLPSSPTEYSRLFGPLSLHVRSTRRYVASDNTLNRPDADLGIRLEDDQVNPPKFKLWDLKRRPLLHAALQMTGIFLVSTILLGGTLWLALPTLSEEDRPQLRIPKTFAELQDLNMLLKKYKTIYPFRTVICFVVTYLFLQAFSLPGSMYLSILGGAVWGMAVALPLCCACVATGATLCYAISAALGPALLTLPKWKDRIDKWALKVETQRSNLLSFLIVLRIAPFPPHWVVNVVCPHLGIGVLPFWISTFFGIMGVTVIHTTIGGGLDEMTSAKDFRLISWENALGLSAIVIAVLIPVGLRYYWRSELQSVADVENPTGDDQVQLEGVIVESGGIIDGPDKAKAIVGPPTGTLILLDDSDDEEEDFDPYSRGDVSQNASDAEELDEIPRRTFTRQ